jgi:hypothetical protein
MEQFIRILIELLVSKGMEITAIPAFIRDVGTSIATNPAISLLELNSHLQLLGWGNFELDDYTFYLIVTILEPDFAYNLIHSLYPIFNPHGYHKLSDEKEHVLAIQIAHGKPLQE